MAKQPVNQRQHTSNRKKQVDWFGSSDEAVEAIADWDIKVQLMAEAILGVLSNGDGIMFGVSFAGDAISVTVYSGEVKKRKWVSDSIELDDLMAALARRARDLRGKVELKVVEDVAD